MFLLVSWFFLFKLINFILRDNFKCRCLVFFIMVGKLSSIFYIIILGVYIYVDINDVFQLNYYKINIVGFFESYNMVDWCFKDWVFFI